MKACLCKAAFHAHPSSPCPQYQQAESMLSLLYPCSFLSLIPFIYTYWEHSWEALILPLTTVTF